MKEKYFVFSISSCREWCLAWGRSLHVTLQAHLCLSWVLFFSSHPFWPYMPSWDLSLALWQVSRKEIRKLFLQGYYFEGLKKYLKSFETEWRPNQDLIFFFFSSKYTKPHYRGKCHPNSFYSCFCIPTIFSFVSISISELILKHY